MSDSKKTYEIIQASTTAPKVVDTGKRKLKFGNNGAMHVSDPAEAMAIQQRYGKGQVLMMEVDNPRYTGRSFSVRLPKNYKRGEE